ncbi:hypothetical protein [Nocardia panacis]|nr:hypothetical protein [Nocardia panacis]
MENLTELAALDPTQLGDVTPALRAALDRHLNDAGNTLAFNSFINAGE